MFILSLLWQTNGNWKLKMTAKLLVLWIYRFSATISKVPASLAFKWGIFWVFTFLTDNLNPPPSNNSLRVSLIHMHYNTVLHISTASFDTLKKNRETDSWDEVRDFEWVPAYLLERSLKQSVRCKSFFSKSNQSSQDHHLQGMCYSPPLRSLLFMFKQWSSNINN